MSDVSVKMKTIRLKFCGGCNPEYDRLAVAENIQRRLTAAGYRLVGADESADGVVAVCGCACACADVGHIDRGRVFFVGSPAMADCLLAKLTGGVVK